MTQINTGACVAYTPKQMYDLVNDAAAYPRYLPLCSEVAICSQGEDRLTAKITLAKGKIKLDFTTANVMEDGKRIDMDLVDGPFKYLHATWLFSPTSDGGAEVSFKLDFEFSNPLLRVAFGSFFKGIVESMVGAFCEQAALRYGDPHGSGVAAHKANT
ncbi:MAG: ubiquinone-binding protein [Candidatus Methylumidiphilus alinenensis]|uniref:Ubiquinone-binding protein n=1 Tax=Candidatus Methylumidiphilus alinenensis TaxID=2202197 RepID=A0A2W4QYB3_9GAMM|nr:MAG: ubiquinone-binding protein [Candidatus Methylumidiphilus alinenensis]